jgi:hypothetical protein
LKKLRSAADQIAKIKQTVGQTAVEKANAALDDLQRDSAAEYEDLIRNRWNVQRVSTKNV